MLASLHTHALSLLKNLWHYKALKLLKIVEIFGEVTPSGSALKSRGREGDTRASAAVTPSASNGRRGATSTGGPPLLNCCWTEADWGASAEASTGLLHGQRPHRQDPLRPTPAAAAQRGASVQYAAPQDRRWADPPGGGQWVRVRQAGGGTDLRDRRPRHQIGGVMAGPIACSVAPSFTPYLRLKRGLC